jgi:ketosteroid isomerase-like protein
MKLFSLALFFCFLYLNSFSQLKEEESILKILDEQTKEWNNGNLEKFMSGYWRNDSLVFIGKSGPVYGYNNALNNYKKSYPDTASMGKLRFEVISVKKLSKAYYFVTGKWFLNKTAGNVKGIYTLLFRKINTEWKIVVDHSS